MFFAHTENYEFIYQLVNLNLCGEQTVCENMNQNSC